MIKDKEGLEKNRNKFLDNRFVIFFDRLIRKVFSLNALLIVILLLAMIVSLIIYSLPSIKQFGISFLYNNEWDPYFQRFGALPFIISTLLTSFLALILCVPFALALAILLGEYFTEGFISSLLRTLIECLGGIPSVIYGFWGLLILAPLIHKLEIKFGIEGYGVGIFTASIVLAIMIIPYAASISRDAISMVPKELKEAGYSLGATRYELLKKVIMPYASSGIFAGILLSLGRALGETMAVTMLVGNSNFIPKSIFAPANTMASIIANEFTEATGELYLSSLIHIALWLSIITMIVNITGKLVMRKMIYEERYEKQTR